MTNVVVLIGVVENAYFDENKNSCFIDLKIEKTIKKENEGAEFDYYKIKLWRGMYNDLTSIKTFKKNVILGVKGRLEKENDVIYVMAEKISFLGKTNTTN